MNQKLFSKPIPTFPLSHFLTLVLFASTSLLVTSPVSAALRPGEQPGLVSPPVDQLGATWDSTGRKITHFKISDGSPTPSFAAADFGSDGISEFLVGAGVGEKPIVRTIRADGSDINSITAFANTMTRGVYAVPADTNGDGQNEIIVATGPRAIGEVRTLDLSGANVVGSKPFFPYGKNFTNGISLAAGDLNQDGKDEILTVPLAGSLSDVVIWRADGVKIGSLRAFANTFRGGTHLVVGNVLGDQKPEIIAVPATGGNLVRIFDGQTFKFLTEFTAIDPKFGGGLQLTITASDPAATDLQQIAVIPAGAGGPHVFFYSGDGQLKNSYFVSDLNYRGGVLLSFGAFSSDQPAQLATLLAQPTGYRSELVKAVSVDLSEQRLRAYENGVLVRTFLVSTGKVGPTPTGVFPILARPYNVHYRGPDYDLGIVPFNMRFLPSYYLHYAPWHNNFGAPMSHGCVNIGRTDAEWIYNWTEVGVPVEISG